MKRKSSTGGPERVVSFLLEEVVLSLEVCEVPLQVVEPRGHVSVLVPAALSVRFARRLPELLERGLDRLHELVPGDSRPALLREVCGGIRESLLERLGVVVEVRLGLHARHVEDELPVDFLVVIAESLGDLRLVVKNRF